MLSSIAPSRRVLAAASLFLLLLTSALIVAAPARAASRAQLADRVLAQVNAVRTQHHLPRLRENALVTRQAAAHTNRMARHNRNAARFAGERSVATRLRATGYRPRAVAQHRGSARTQHALLHRARSMERTRRMHAQLLSRRYTNVGIAVRYSARHHRYWLTVLLAKRAPLTTAEREDSYARSVLHMMNRERAVHGRHPLHMNRTLIRSAHWHNLTMARANTMSHQLVGEQYFANRILRAGYRYQYAAENIGWNSRRTCAGLHQLQAMMYHERPPDDGHRQNILSWHYTDVGIDVFLDNVHHKVWLTQDFGSH